MKLIDIINKSGVLRRNGESLPDVTVKGISCNSREVGPGYIFVAISGTHVDGHRYIHEAVTKGASAVFYGNSQRIQQHYPGVALFGVDDTRLALAQLAAEFYGHPSTRLKVIGITGTNGKTTVSYLLEALLKENGKNPAVIGTVNYRYGQKILSAKNTTPGPLELQPMLADMLDDGIEYVAMEVSSHALDQKRTEGIRFHSAIFTNLTQDHLDYHSTLENYFLSKSRLFRTMDSQSFVVLNADDAYGVRLRAMTDARVITYGITRQAEIAAKEIMLNMSNSVYLVKTPTEEDRFTVPFIGQHNVYNVLALAAWAHAEGFPLSATKSALENFSCVPGRLERIEHQGKFSVFVDFAHTEDALRNVILSLRKIAEKRIIVVFGCGGERDRTKRPKMGRVVTELADYAIITNDNPRSEDPGCIIDEIKEGINSDNYRCIPDRREAILASLRLAEAGDIVLIAGKGHESFQIEKDKSIPFNDKEVVRECLQSLNS
jgi:UDP-N-acetylmuramoyl-L-alanyl-D-glutamate--2,6-diaminopimelate ligase